MKIVRRVKDISLVMSSLAFAGLAIFTLQNQITFSMVKSKSMEPIIQAGDIVISKLVKKVDVERGDVLILPLPQNRDFTYMHRVVELNRSVDGTIIRTKGDSNPIPDKWLIELLSPEVPKVISVVNSSFVFNSPTGREFIYTGLIGASFLLFLLALWRTLSRRRS